MGHCRVLSIQQRNTEMRKNEVRTDVGRGAALWCFNLAHVTSTHFQRKDEERKDGVIAFYHFLSQLDLKFVNKARF